MSRISVVFAIAIAFAIVSTSLLAVHLLIPHHVVSSAPGQTINASSPAGSAVHGTGSSAGSWFVGSSGSSPALVLQILLNNSPFFSPLSWVFLGGVWIWRGKMRSRWESVGFDSQTFDLFTKMSGARTRIGILGSLSTPKDRLQLAKELGLDWKAVDYQIALLAKYGLVHEGRAYGRVKLYQLTEQGEILLRLLREFVREAPTGIDSVNNLSQGIDT